MVYPELIEAIKIVDTLARTRSYAEVFSGFIDWCVWQHLFPPKEDENSLEKYTEKDREYFLSIWKIIREEVKKKTGLWTGDWYSWYDPLGRMYECIASKNKSSLLGQYFTPSPVVDMMTRIINPGENKTLQRILDPACGSGRMGLSAGASCMAQGIPSWISMIDLDPICAKMSAVNMCFHGFVGEVLCMNGLDITGASYRFGYRIFPSLAFIPQELWEFQRMVIMFKTREDIRKQYVLVSIPYSETYVSQINEELIKEWEGASKIKEAEAKEKAVNELKDKVRSRLAGTLFENDKEIIDDVVLPEKSQRNSTPKKNKKADEDDQLSLF